MAGKRRADPALLKNRVLNSLTRLADRDTLAVAAKELNRAITSVAAEDLGIIVACLVDDASSSPKPIARAEVLRLFELVATTQGEHALYYLPRMLTACTRRFRDIDTAVQDACVDAIGALAHFAVRCRPGVHLGNVNVMAGPEAMGRASSDRGSTPSATATRAGRRTSRAGRSRGFFAGAGPASAARASPWA